MKIGIIFDLKEDYNFNNTEFSDFTTIEEVMVLSNILSENGHDIELIHGVELLLNRINDIKNSVDIVINLTEGFATRNREARVPALLELHNIPYIGSDCYANNITLDKYLTKLLAREVGVLTPSFALFLKQNLKIIGDIPKAQQLILKPAYEGSSDGIVLLSNLDNLHVELTKLCKQFNQNILIEEYVSGSDYSIAVYGNMSVGYTIIGGVKIQDQNLRNLIIYDRKYKANYYVKKTLPDWSPKLKKNIFDSCVKLAEIIELSGFFRFDFRVMGKKAYFLEINSIPSLSLDGSFLKAIQINNLNTNDVFERILKNENIKFKSSY